MSMTNKEKANQIFDGMGLKPPYHKYQFVGAIEHAIELTEQQMIDRACDFINQHFCITSNDHARSKEEYYNLTELTRDFINAME